MIIRNRQEFQSFLKKLIDISETVGYKYCKTIEWKNDKLTLSNKELSNATRNYLIDAAGENLEILKKHDEPLIVTIMVENKKILSKRFVNWRISNLSAIEMLSRSNYNKYSYLDIDLYLYEISPFYLKNKQNDAYVSQMLDRLKNLDV